MTVVAGAAIRADGAILMQQRRLGSAHGGLWEFPGGKLEAGETPELALARELQEELGITVACDSLVPCGFAADRAGEATNRPAIVILLYVFRQWDGDPQCLDGEAIDWFAPQDILGLDMPPLDVPLAKQLVTFMKIGAI